MLNNEDEPLVGVRIKKEQKTSRRSQELIKATQYVQKVVYVSGQLLRQIESRLTITIRETYRS